MDPMLQVHWTLPTTSVQHGPDIWAGDWSANFEALLALLGLLLTEHSCLPFGLHDLLSFPGGGHLPARV